ncbi:X-box-binding protein 1 [Vespa velutina]|uniref:X-box-binding protein 1 n=1 Tax=Vespa crabro TaxID=7445 RepID=UPI001EFF6E6A|nr:X-box-binding protein 1 [Vespa crabro]XP_047345958.1 X-box-binding protein 1 [Vespa velutina]
MNMSALKSVVIAFPKGLSKGSAIVPNNDLVRSVPKLNFSTSILTDKTTEMDITRKIPKQEELHEESAFFKPDVCIRGKKRRLDHLTWEEKLQRKKLKNRVAAQTSRDRKKAKLDELEETVRTLRERNDVLTQECALLKSQNESLISETKILRRERETSNMSEQLCSSCQARVGCPVPSLGSAVSPQNPLPQGGTVQSAPSLTLTPGAAILLKIMTLYLLSKNYLEISKGMITSIDSKNLQKASFEKLPQKWKQILIDQMNKCQTKKIQLKNLIIQKEWWGRHQKMWKPIQSLVEA